MHHYPWTAYRYAKGNRSDKRRGECPFCSEKQLDLAIETTETMYVIPNRTKYDLFEGLPVERHLLVIPKQHHSSLAEFAEAEQRELLAIVARYEAEGYHFFGHGVGAITRSVEHQHTHLIMPANNSLRTRTLRRIKQLLF